MNPGVLVSYCRPMRLFKCLLPPGCLLLLSLAAASAGSKYLIEFGWDEPTPAFMRKHVEEMERMPFDGCVFHIAHTDSQSNFIAFTSNAWGKHRFSRKELEPAIEDLLQTRFHKLQRNFLRLNVTPGDVDWFEDFSAILSNAGWAAKMAREGRCDGILLDVEAYAAPVFDFKKLSLKSQKSWEQYQVQARLRGSEFMSAIQSEFPEITLFLTFGYSMPWAQTENGKKPLQDCENALLPAFLDGMVATANGRAQIVDGCELSYSFKEPGMFDRDYKAIRDGLLPMVADPEKYHRVVSIGFGLWMDFDSHKVPWDTSDFSKNYYSPAAFKISVSKALASSDKYVWIYTQTPKWWTEKGGPEKLPADYLSAMREAKGK
jgi:hypothetical protein